MGANSGVSPMGRLTGLLVLVLACSLHASAAEVLYSENFDAQEGKGATGDSSGAIGSMLPPVIDLDGVDWTIDVSNAVLRGGNDYFRVNNGVFEGRDLDGIAIWFSARVPTLLGQLIEVSVDYDWNNASVGVDEKFVISLSTDGGLTYVPLVSSTDPVAMLPGTARMTAVGTGDSFYVRIAANNNTGSDVFAFDNVTLTAIPEPLAASTALVGFGALVLRR
ncbi:MAG: hypothetical protein AAF743_00300 [Planctomycetota bacterium]